MNPPEGTQHLLDAPPPTLLWPSEANNGDILYQPHCQLCDWAPPGFFRLWLAREKAAAHRCDGFLNPPREDSDTRTTP